MRAWSTKGRGLSEGRGQPKGGVVSQKEAWSAKKGAWSAKRGRGQPKGGVASGGGGAVPSQLRPSELRTNPGRQRHQKEPKVLRQR